MGCCTSSVKDVNNELQDVDKNRKCTDKFWLILFAICWILLTVVSFWSTISGNPSRIIRGYDSFGNICGQTNKRIEGISWSGMDMTELPYVFHMNPSNVSSTLKICVKKCADKNLTNDGDLLMFMQTAGSKLYRYDFDHKNSEIAYSRVSPSEIVRQRNKDEELGFGPGPRVPVTKQRPILNRCVGTERIKLGNSFINNVYSYIKNMEIAQKIVSDLYASMRAISLTVGFGILISLLVTFTIHYMASIVSLVMMLLSSLILISLTAFSWYVYFDLKYKLNQIPSIEQLDDDIINEKTFLLFSIFLTIVSLIILIITYYMKDRIGLMVALFAETASCLRSMPALVFQPIWTCSVLILFLAFWTTVFFAIATSEEEIRFNATTTRFQLHLPARAIEFYNNGKPQFANEARIYQLESVKHKLPPLLSHMLVFLVVMLFWSSEFILGCQQMVVASSVATWYFTRDKSALGCTIGNSIIRTAKYHLGSIALGSFVIVLFKVPRIILAFLEQQLKKYKDNSSCVNVTFKCCHCFWYCMENFIQYINHNAYTIIAIEGTPYCYSAKIAFKTLTSNTLRILTINTMGDFIIFLGKCVVTGSAAIFGVYMMRGETSVHYLTVPVLFASVITYLIAHSMLCVYEMVIDTMFLCFVEDINKNARSPEGFFAPDSLLKFAQEDIAEIQQQGAVPMIAVESNNGSGIINKQPVSGNGGGFNGKVPIGFVYPNLVESSH